MDCKSKGFVNTTYIIETVEGSCDNFKTNLILSCSGDTSIELSTGDIILNGDITPLFTNTFNIGTPTNRFKNINTISGTSTVWTSTNVVNTPNLNLGLDLSNNYRVLTANNSIIEGDILFGGYY